MEFTLTYHSARAEVMRWYWEMWKQRLWKNHLQAVALVSVIAYLSLPGNLALPVRAAASLLVGLCAIVIFVIYPMVAFKSQLRTLVVADSGISTTIGKRSGEFTWKDVQAIRRMDDCICIVRKTLNAFIIPPRAFLSEDDAEEFFATIKRWHDANG
jgi:hypothetical protein